MKYIVILLVLFFSSLAYSQSDTLIKNLHGYCWLWVNGNDSIDIKDAMTKKDTFNLYRITEYEHVEMNGYIAYSATGADDFRIDLSAQQKQHFDSLKDDDSFTFKIADTLKNIYELDVEFPLKVIQDNNGSWLPTGGIEDSIFFTHDQKDNILNVNFDYAKAANTKREEKHFKYKVAIFNSKQIALIPVN